MARTQPQEFPDTPAEQGSSSTCCGLLLDRTQTTKKPYLGGYSHKARGTVYHHALAQTKIAGVTAAHIANVVHHHQLAISRHWSHVRGLKRAVNGQTDRTNPTQPADFERLRSEVEEWRKQESAVVETQLSLEQIQFARLILLQKETQLLAALDRMSSKVYAEARDKAIEAQIDRKCRPKQLSLSSGSTIQVYLSETFRAMEVFAMFQKLAGPASSASARLETLRLAKEHLGAPEGSAAASPVALLDREADLINRQRLRKRPWDLQEFRSQVLMTEHRF